MFQLFSSTLVEILYQRSCVFSLSKTQEQWVFIAQTLLWQMNVQKRSIVFGKFTEPNDHITCPNFSQSFFFRWIFIPLGQALQSRGQIKVQRLVWFPPREPFWGAPAALGSLSRSPAGYSGHSLK